MPYDPTKPANNAPIVSSELRSQFAGLKQSIDDVQAQANESPSEDRVTDLIVDNAAKNVDGVPILTLTVSNPPTQAQVQSIVTKLNDLILGLHR